MIAIMFQAEAVLLESSRLKSSYKGKNWTLQQHYTISLRYDLFAMGKPIIPNRIKAQGCAGFSIYLTLFAKA